MTKLKTYLRPIAYTLWYAIPFINENGVMVFLRLMTAHLLGLKNTFPVTIGGTKVLIRSSSTDLVVAYCCFALGEFEILRKYTSSPKVIVDAGGYIGTAAMALSKIYPQAKIYCLEPNRENFSVLKKNIESYRNITALNVALFSTTSSGVILNAGNGEWGLSAKPLNENSNQDVDIIQGVSMSTLMSDYAITHIDVLKLDIEGGEVELFSKNIEWVANTGIIIAELHDNKVPGCRESLERACVGMSYIQTDGEKILAHRKVLT